MTRIAVKEWFGNQALADVYDRTHGAWGLNLSCGCFNKAENYLSHDDKLEHVQGAKHFGIKVSFSDLVSVYFVCGEVVKETEKAVCIRTEVLSGRKHELQGKTWDLWIPKSQLVAMDNAPW